MAIELITGRAGAPHVDSADVGAFNAAMFGGGAYVIEGVEATLQDANHVVISAGEMLCEGRHIRIVGAGETLTIDNGLSGYKRNDIVAMHYERDSSDIENCSLVVIKGNQDTETPQDPPMPTSGKLLEGAASVYWPLYRIVVDGLTPQTPKFIAQRQALYTLGVGEEIPEGADLNDYTVPGVYTCFTSGVATSLQNCPVDKTFTLLVSKNIQSTDPANYPKHGTIQTLATLNNNVQQLTWTRMNFSEEWKTWTCPGGIDSIVSEGDSGGWYYEKYANGICKLYYRKDHTMSVNNAFGNMYDNTQTLSFPFTVTNIKTFDVAAYRTGYLVDATPNTISNTQLSLFVKSPGSMTNVTISILAYVVGHWK